MKFMPDDNRRFALRENGQETSVFENVVPRQAALKSARQLESRDHEADAAANPERIRLREHGTVDIHIYDAWAWEERVPDDDPEWLGDTITQANVRKVGVETTTKSESELDYSQLAPLLIEQPIPVMKDECEECGHSLDDSYYSATPVRDVPSNISTIRYMRYRYECSSCGTKTRGEHPHCSSVGRFGTNALAQAILFYYEYRLSHRNVSDVFKQLYNFDISPASVTHVRDYLFPVAKSKYDEIHKNIKTANVLYIDETQFPVDSDKYWLWGFTTGEESLYALRESRGSAVLEEILGDVFNGIIVCDGWTGYSAYHSQLQRCWAHLLREKDDLSGEDIEAHYFYEKLQRSYRV